MGTTALVADDEPDMRTLVRTALERQTSWTVVEARDGEEALARCRDTALDVVILDQRMPKMTGMDVARALQDSQFDAPIVLFSAYLDEDLSEEAARLGLVTVEKSEIGRLVDIARGLVDGRDR